MKSPRPRTFSIRAALAALSLILLVAPAAYAQDPKPAQTPPQPPGGGGPGKTNRDRNPTGPFTTREVMKRAEITDNPQPPSSGQPQDDAPSGVVRLRAILSHTGVVTDIKVLKGLPDGLTEKAIAAARLIKFTPAQKDGRAVSQYVTLEYAFNVYDEDDKEVTKKVEITEQPRPHYIEEAVRNNVEGKVVVEAIFGEDGKVVSPEVVEGLPHGLSAMAVEAALRIKFKPAERKGRKVAVRRRVVYDFALAKTTGTPTP